MFTNQLSTSSLELDDQASIITYEEYYPYGSTSFQCGRSCAEVSLKRYRYTGKEKDEETGFYYHGARYFCSWIARWIAVDTLETKFSPESPYNYGHNNPVTWQDSTGKQADTSSSSGSSGSGSSGSSSSSNSNSGSSNSSSDSSSSSSSNNSSGSSNSSSSDSGSSSSSNNGSSESNSNGGGSSSSDSSASSNKPVNEGHPIELKEVVITASKYSWTGPTSNVSSNSPATVQTYGVTTTDKNGKSDNSGDRSSSEGDGKRRAETAKEKDKNDTRTYGQSREKGYKTDNKVDCSEFTAEVQAANGYKSASNAAGQAEQFKKSGEYSTDFKDVKVGDQLFFGKDGKIDHTAIVVDVNKDGTVNVVHATVNKHKPGSIKQNTTDKSGNIKGFSKFVGLGRPKNK